MLLFNNLYWHRLLKTLAIAFLFSSFELCQLRSFTAAWDKSNIIGYNYTSVLDHSYDDRELNLSSRTELTCRDKWRRNYLLQSEQGVKDVIPVGVDILLVHIGKSGGTSVRRVLNKILKLPFHEVHMMSVTKDHLLAFKYIVITSRDPIERYVSAFYWRSFTVERMGYSRIEDANSTERKAFYECTGDDINNYAAFLMDTSSECGTVVRLGESHTSWDMCAYLGGVLPELRQHGGIFVVETENLIDDLNELAHWLLPYRLRKRREIDENNMPSVLSYKKQKVETPLTDNNRASMRGYFELIGEYALYRELRALSVNLKSRSTFW